MLENDWNLFMELLRAGLWEKDLHLQAAPDAACWGRLLQISRVQAVTGLFLRGITHLPKDQIPPASIRMRILAEADEIERQNLQVNQAERDILDFYAWKGLHPLVLKGSHAARYYAKSLLRQSGDIDLYFPDGAFSEACALVPQAGKSPDGSVIFTHKGVTVEIHPRYYDLHLPENQLPAVPSVLGELLLYSSHILKHALGVGIGLKQLCDLARAMACLDGQYSKQDMQKALEKAGLLRWNRLLCSMLVQDLGLDPQYCLPDFTTCSPRPLEKIIRKGGNFGISATLRKKGLRSGRPFSRKTATAFSFLCRLPFSLRYAPKETSSTIAELVKGNL
jgi:hypothetical protein